MVQDSTSGVVFTSPSGVSADLTGYEAQVHVQAVQDVKAVEIRSLSFNVWGELSAYLGATVLTERAAGERFDIHPRWRDVDAPTHEHRTTIVWIHRVMLGDESVREAGLEPIAGAWAHVTGGSLERLPEGILHRALGP
jgi:hypothetical protein